MNMRALIEAHCRHAAGQVPRGVEGCATALAVLAALPDACGRNLPDVTATTPRVWEVLVHFGLIAAAPSRRIRVAALRLLARVTPLVEARSSRQWSVWFAQALDPESPPSQRLRANTPAAQIEVKASAEPIGQARRRDTQREVARLRQEAEESRAAAASARGELAAVEEGHARALAVVEQAKARLAEQLAGAERERDELRRVHADVVRERDRAQSSLATAGAELVTLTQSLAAKQREVATVREELAVAVKDAAAGKVRIAALERASAARASLMETVAALQQQLAEAKAGREKAETAEREGLEELAELKETVTSLEEDLQFAETERLQLDETIKALTASRDERQSTIAALQAKIVELGEECAGLRDAQRKAHEARTAADRTAMEYWRELERERLDHGVLKEKVAQLRKLYIRRCAEISIRKRWSPPVDERRLAAAIDEEVRQHESRASEE